MSVFNVSFANKKAQSSGQDYGVLVDQLDILESTLSADGKLSPGDYSLLTQKAQQLYGHPGLSSAQRSNIEVKIASYKSSGSKSTIQMGEDITRINNLTKDDNHSNAMFLGGNPVAYLQAQSDSQKNKRDALANAIDRLNQTGQDATAHVQEYVSASNDYEETLIALDVVKNHVPGTFPTSDQVAYITTNSKGEIVSVNVGREGSKSGYLETNGLYGGLKIYGKLNHKENGENMFILGGTKFTGSDVQIIDLVTGGVRSSPLTAGGKKVGAQFGESYVDVASETLKTQSAIPGGNYGRGSTGFLYKKNEDGTYIKFTSADQQKMNISDNDIQDLPQFIEQSIAPLAKETVSMAPEQPTLPISAPSVIPNMSIASPSNSSIAPAPAGRPSTPAPIDRAPKGFLGVAAGAIKSAGSFLGNLFAGGK